MRATVGDPLIVISFTEIPQTDLVEVMKADGAGYRVNKDGIRNGARNNVREVDFEEICAAKHGAGIEVADADQNQKD